MGRLRHTAFALSALFALTLAGTVGFMRLEGYGAREALFMTVTVLSTVGMQVRPLGPGGQLLTVALVVLGLGLVLYTVALVAQQLVEGELQEVLGRRRMKRTIEAMERHVIVCGFGRIGRMVCRELHAKPMPFVVVEREESAAQRAESEGYAVLAADATEEDTLQRARVAGAAALIAALPSDAENVFITLTARALRSDLVVVARAETESGAERLRQAGATRVVSPYAIGGHRMAQAILRPAVLDFVDLATHHRSLELQLEEIPIGRPGVAPLAESGVRDHVDVMVIAIRTAAGETRFNPAPSEPLAQGDRLLAVGEARSLRVLEQKLAY
jgi:voltage-gated potassium channel